MIAGNMRCEISHDEMVDIQDLLVEHRDHLLLCWLALTNEDCLDDEGIEAVASAVIVEINRVKQALKLVQKSFV